MSYVLPDEPKGAIRPDLAVSALWPFLALMFIGPLPGFAWLAFNSWALGCRHAIRHTVIALISVPALGIAATLTLDAADVFAGAEAIDMINRLLLVVIQAGGLVLAFWIMWDQNDAEEWRKMFGQRPRNGIAVFVVLLSCRIFLATAVPTWVYLFAFWAPG